MSVTDGERAASQDGKSYVLQIYARLSLDTAPCCTLRVHKEVTAAAVVKDAAATLGLDTSKFYVLAEVKECGGEEWILEASDLPVQRVLLWPRKAQEQHPQSEGFYFLLQQRNEDGSIHYVHLSNLSEEREVQRLAARGFLPPQQEDFDDLCNLPRLTVSSILDNLRNRFQKKKIYTYAGSILIAINPFKFLPIYNPKYVKMYENHQLGKLEPHIFAIADVAYYAMLRKGMNQCIVISGESGSGKTQSTNFLIHCLTALSQKGYASGVERTILGAGPVLEAFGNAKTAHNNNSSRFGKFIQVNYLESGIVRGAVVEKYLLEKSRLVSREKNERNYHVFYYLLVGASEDERKEFKLLQPEDYFYLKQQNFKIEDEEDLRHDFERLQQAMEMVGFLPATKKQIFSVLSAILYLGNVTYRRKSTGREEGLDVGPPEVLTTLSDLLKVKEEELVEALTKRKTVTANDKLILPYSHSEAITARDSMAKSLYSALFDWIVLRINHALLNKKDMEESVKCLSIGVLDIFGFEDFETNSFEQFCINYANEQLHYYFNQHIFKLEQEEYKAEGITWHNIDYTDNVGCIHLISKKPTGLFFLLDEESNFPHATDKTLLAKFKQQHQGNKYFVPTPVLEPAFVIQHFAGNVKYHIKDFREKNTDHMRPDIVALLRSSERAYVRELVGMDPVAMFRWAILRATIRGMAAFNEAGRQWAAKTAGVVRGVSRSPLTELQRSNTVVEKIYRDMHAQIINSIKDLQLDGEDPRKLLQSWGRLRYPRHLLQKNKNTKQKQIIPKSLIDSRSLKFIVGLTLYDRTTKSLLHLHKKKKPPSISAQFQTSLSKLLETLGKAEPFFIRCIRSNAEKREMCFDESLVLQQLRYTGMLETVRIRRSGYSAKYTFQEFIEHFRVLLPKNATASQDDVSALLQKTVKDNTMYQIGKSKVFLKELVRQQLQDTLHKDVMCKIIFLQRWFRAKLERKHFLSMRKAAIIIQRFWRRSQESRCKAAIVIQAAWRAFQQRALYLQQQACIKKIQALVRGNLARRRVQAMQEEKRQLEEAKRAEEELRQRELDALQKKLEEEIRQRELEAQQKLQEVSKRREVEAQQKLEEETRQRELAAQQRYLKKDEAQQEDEARHTKLEGERNEEGKPEPESELEEVHVQPKPDDENKEAEIRHGGSVPAAAVYEKVGEIQAAESYSLNKECKENEAAELPCEKPTMASLSQSEEELNEPKRSFVSQPEEKPRPLPLHRTTGSRSQEKREQRRQRGLEHSKRECQRAASASKEEPTPKVKGQDAVTGPEARQKERADSKELDQYTFVAWKMKEEKGKKEVKASASPPSRPSSLPLRTSVHKPSRNGFEESPCAKHSEQDIVKEKAEKWKEKSSEGGHPDISSPEADTCDNRGTATSLNLGFSVSVENLTKLNSGSNASSAFPSQKEVQSPIETACEVSKMNSLRRKNNDSSGHPDVIHLAPSTPEKPGFLRKILKKRPHKEAQTPDDGELTVTQLLIDKGHEAFPASHQSRPQQHASTSGSRGRQNPPIKISRATRVSGQWHTSLDRKISNANELRQLDEFLGNQVNDLRSSGKNLSGTEQIFISATMQFRETIKSMYSLPKPQIGYKALMTNYQNMVVTLAGEKQKSEVQLVVNLFQSVLDIFIRLEIKKEEAEPVKLTKARKKRRKKEKSLESPLDHMFDTYQVNIMQSCDQCSSYIWGMETAYMCSSCKMVCHKKCISKIVTDCYTFGAKKTEEEPGSQNFGVRVCALISDKNPVPIVLEMMLEHVEMNGLYTEGIYRKSGAANRMKELRQLLETEPGTVCLEDYPIHTVTGLVKQWLRELPDPLMTFTHYSEFIRAVELPEKLEQLHAIYKVLEQLPAAHFNTLERLVYHLVKVAKEEAHNRMSPNALAIVFAPCILRCPDTADPLMSMKDVAKTTMCVEMLINEQTRRYNEKMEEIVQLEFAEELAVNQLQIRRQNTRCYLPLRFSSPCKGVVIREKAPSHLSAVCEEQPTDLDREAEKSLLERIKSIKQEKVDLACRLPELEQPGSDQENLDSEASVSSESLLEDRPSNSDTEGKGSMVHKRAKPSCTQRSADLTQRPTTASSPQAAHSALYSTRLQLERRNPVIPSTVRLPPGVFSRTASHALPTSTAQALLHLRRRDPPSRRKDSTQSLYIAPGLEPFPVSLSSSTPNNFQPIPQVTRRFSDPDIPHTSENV
ncbi:unconventional myosin-IXb isoform X3 [Scleropages formosus]|uniref:unconventional myosin-IXb isoform X3 n=1 Tax=Scleropages formosus TaxID=113540 RepID=UPI0010FAA588|nr:unconventional myosin-IXb-like isoform X3 [Scleropages formosus]